MKTASQESKTIYRLPTQERRAQFIRKELRRAGISVKDLADAADLNYQTVAKYADLCGNWGTATVDPRTDTTRKIFNALGYDLCFTSRESKGVIEL